MKIIKKIFELIFIFVIPFVICCLSFHKVVENSYDPENNLINVDTSYDWSVPFNDFKNDYHYINILHFNQLVTNGNFLINTGWNSYDSNNNILIENNELILTLNTSNIGYRYGFNQINNNFLLNVRYDKLFVCGYFKSSVDNLKIGYDISNKSYSDFGTLTTSYNYIYDFVNAHSSNSGIYFYPSSSYNIGDLIYAKDIQIINLTKMFGSGNEPTTIEDLNVYINTYNYYDTVLDEEIKYVSDSIVSGEYSYNYTIWGYLFNNILVDSLKINDCFSSRLICSYVVLVVFMIFVYHMIIYPLILIFKIIFFKD